ncbi:DnaJ domain-containing protein [Cryptosporidium ubiquitum]|uniref:DnaJ domain-containing protein n=1 Tax=Cryptosporidium ubiquitum TaxID=857276 RepID=A0A1J4MLA7_9CRYT|nr:DnaJ domain-containing protein [Cryptosporidium ubiquitum]OII74235.1 DnaJ domain-containing protein [Cryptosporidium ubiquitum]
MGKKKSNRKQELNSALQRNVSIGNSSAVLDNNLDNFRSSPNSLVAYFQSFRWAEVKEALINLSVILLILAVFVFTVILRAGEEFYSVHGKLNKNENQRNYYEVLGVSKKSSNSEIRKAFRKLSLVWHPDKNPDCEPCLEKFRDISKAYEILGDDEKRQIYDTTQGGEIEIIPSAAVTLTSDNFDDLVTFQTTNSWVIQVYTDHDELCHYFSSIWEESIEEMGKYYRFGRIHAKKESLLLKKLPLNVKVFPAIFIITNGYPYEIYSQIYDPSLESFLEFLSNSFPITLSLLNSEKSMQTWIKKNNAYKPKILIVSNKPFPTLLIRSSALKWSSTFEFAYFHNSKKTTTLYKWGIETSKPYLVAFPQIVDNTELIPRFVIPLGDHSNEHVLQTRFINDHILSLANNFTSLTQKLEHSLLYLQQIYVPFVDSNNAKNLCESNSLNRIICLMIIHDKLEDGQVQNQEVIQALNISRQDYIKLKRNSENTSNGIDEEVDEDIGELFIQPIQVTLSSKVSGIPSMSKIKGFMELTRNVTNSGFLLIDFDGDRFSILEALTDVYQKVFEEEIFWTRLPQVCTNYNSNNLYRNCLFGSSEELSFFQMVSALLKLRNILYIFIITTSIYFFKKEIKISTNK